MPAGDLSKHSDNKLGGNLEVISHFSLWATEVCNDPDDHLWSSRYRTLMIIRESPDYYIWVKYSLVSSLGSTCQATPVPYFNLSEQACRISEEGCRVSWLFSTFLQIGGGESCQNILTFYCRLRKWPETKTNKEQTKQWKHWETQPGKHHLRTLVSISIIIIIERLWCDFWL